jgi:hypothetical protein
LNAKDDFAGYNGITITGILTTLQMILGLIEDQVDIVARVHPMVYNLVMRIMESFASDYFDECSRIIETLITQKVSPEMWNVFDKLCLVFKTEKSMFFCGMFKILCLNRF